MVLDRIVEFLRQLLVRHDELREGHTAMSTDLKTVLAKLDQQSTDIAAQGAQIDKLIAARDAQEQADLDKINALLDANAAASKAKADKLVGALTSTDAKPTTYTLTVAGLVTAPATRIPVTTDATVTKGFAVSGAGIADGTTVLDADTSSITLSAPTTADLADGATLTVTKAAS